MYSKVVIFTFFVAYTYAGELPQATSYSSISSLVSPASKLAITHVAPVAHIAHVAPVAHVAHVAHLTPIHHVAHITPVHHVAHVAHIAPVAHVAHVAHVAPVAPVVKVVKKEVYADAHPKYSFEYGVKDTHTNDIKDQKEERDGDVVKGQYTLLQPDGVTRVVQYTADDKNGFNAQVDYKGKAIHPEVQKKVLIAH